MSERVRVVRIITRLNVGGPAIQALSLTSRLQHHGFDTLLLHGQTDAGEGDMRTVLETGPLSELYIASLRRPVRPLHDIIALLTIYIQLCRYRPRIVHTHMAKAGTLGPTGNPRLQPDGGTGSPRARPFTHTTAPSSTGTFRRSFREGWPASNGPGPVHQRLDRDLLPNPARHRKRVSDGRAEQIRLVPLGFDLARFAAIDGAHAGRSAPRFGRHPGARVSRHDGRPLDRDQAAARVPLGRSAAGARASTVNRSFSSLATAP